MKAEIIVTRHDVFNDLCYQTFEWKGPKTATALINRRLFERYKQQLPWKLNIIEENYLMNSFVVARADKILSINAAFHRIKAFIKRTTTNTKMRIIITAMIWNLGYVPDNEIPSWMHIGKRRG